MNTLTNVEASLYRYLYESLTVAYGIPVFEDPMAADFTNVKGWVVIDTLSTRLGGQPVQIVVLHIGQKENAPNAKEALIRLVDKVVGLTEEGTEIAMYDYDTEAQIGVMTVTAASLQPLMKHRAGGSYRPLTVQIAYPNI